MPRLLGFAKDIRGHTRPQIQQLLIVRCPVTVDLPRHHSPGLAGRSPKPWGPRHFQCRWPGVYRGLQRPGPAGSTPLLPARAGLHGWDKVSSSGRLAAPLAVGVVYIQEDTALPIILFASRAEPQVTSTGAPAYLQVVLREAPVGPRASALRVRHSVPQPVPHLL